MGAQPTHPATGRCQHCGASILWGKSINGKPQPMNLDGATIHFATCPTLKKAPKPFPTQCDACGSSDLRLKPATGPHYGKLTCGECKRFIKFLSREQCEQMGGIPDGGER
jgi:hypothetical protein